MANKPPAFQFYVKDWLSSESVVVMTGEQRGWYIQLLCHAWNSEPIATLPADDRKLKALAGAGDSWATDKQAVLDCFEVDGDRLVNRRLAEQFQQLEEFRNGKSEAGRKGNEARWNKDRKGIARQSHSDDSAIANDRSSTASSTATSLQLSSADRDSRQQSAETGDSRSKALDPDLVKFWAENVSNYWAMAKVYNPVRAAEQCDSYFSSCGPAKRKAILTAWEKSREAPVPSNGGTRGSKSGGDSVASRKADFFSEAVTKLSKEYRNTQNETRRAAIRDEYERVVVDLKEEAGEHERGIFNFFDGSEYALEPLDSKCFQIDED